MAYAQFCYWIKRLGKDKRLSGFTQVSLQASATMLMGLKLVNKGGVEFNSPVAADYLRELLS